MYVVVGNASERRSQEGNSPLLTGDTSSYMGTGHQYTAVMLFSPPTSSAVSSCGKGGGGRSAAGGGRNGGHGMGMECYSRRVRPPARAHTSLRTARTHIFTR